MASQTTLAAVVAHAKEYGFIYPSSEIYEGLQAVYDYGPHGAALKRNVQNLWWQSMTQWHENIVGMDAAILMHPRTWMASGHAQHFEDLLVDNKDSQKRYRVDILIEAHADTLAAQGATQVAQAFLDKAHHLLHAQDLPQLQALLVTEKVTCPVSQTSHWAPIQKCNLMFATQVGAQADEAQTLYLRPETAQGIFVNFMNVQKTSRMRIPFGIAQIGKAFRNEIVARQFIFRMREFEQMELQFFIRPGSEATWMSYWKHARQQWHLALGIPAAKLQLQPHTQLAHYAQEAVDILYDFPFGYKEIEGIHARGDFDLRNHGAYAQKKLQYFDTQLNQHYVPHVVETSLGADRLILMLLCESFTQENEAQKTRTYLRLHPALAPIKAAILPLVRKEGLPEKAKQVFDHLKGTFPLAYEEIHSIGKRYARQDLIGTPYCVTVDHQTLADDTVTLRERDTMAQKRMPIQALQDYIAEKVGFPSILRKLDSVEL